MQLYLAGHLRDVIASCQEPAPSQRHLENTSPFTLLLTRHFLASLFPLRFYSLPVSSVLTFNSTHMLPQISLT